MSALRGEHDSAFAIEHDDGAFACQAAYKAAAQSLMVRSKRPMSERSRKISCAQLCPGAPVTPPPGCVPDPHMYSPRTGPR